MSTKERSLVGDSRAVDSPFLHEVYEFESEAGAGFGESEYLTSMQSPFLSGELSFGTGEQERPLSHLLAPASEIEEEWASEYDLPEQTSPLDGLSPSELKAVRITSTFETGKASSFGGLTGNDDGQGISFGLMNFAWKAGSLLVLLQEFLRNHAAAFAEVFGPDAGRFQEILLATRPDPKNPKRRLRDLDRQMEFARSINDKPPHHKRHIIRQPWSGYFARLERNPQFQRIQVKAARAALKRARGWCEHFGLKTERAFVFMFDLVSQAGGAWLDAPKFKGRRQKLLNARLEAKKARAGRTELTELETLEVIANMIADLAFDDYKELVRVRKLWFVTGKGTVHGSYYDLTRDFGVTDDPPVFDNEQEPESQRLADGGDSEEHERWAVGDEPQEEQEALPGDDEESETDEAQQEDFLESESDRAEGRFHGEEPELENGHARAELDEQETPTQHAAVKRMNEYDPADGTSIVINTVEFATGISGITNYKNWKTDPSVKHNRKKKPYRDPFGIGHLVLHETAADSGDGFDASKGYTAHMCVRRNATILQFNDLAELEYHGIGMNETAVGIEFVNRGWLSSSAKHGGEGIPGREKALTQKQKELFSEARGYLWTFWGCGFNIYRVPPSIDQLEKEVELVEWLVRGLPNKLSEMRGISIYNLFPSIDDTWLQLVAYDEVKDLWTFRNEDLPPEIERANQNLFVMTTGYGYLEPAQIRKKSGIISHNAFYEDHSDGSFLALYTWLRLKKSFPKLKAFALARNLMKYHHLRASLKRNRDKVVHLVDVRDANLV